MCGALGEYTDVVCMPLAGKVRTIDRCIHQIVAALNAGGIETFSCCCGHGKQIGDVLLEDGRTLLILPASMWDRDGGQNWSESEARKAADVLDAFVYQKAPSPGSDGESGGKVPTSSPTPPTPKAPPSK